MKKTTKSSTHNKRGQKENRQARLKAEPGKPRETADRPSRVNEAGTAGTGAARAPARRGAQRDEQKRKLWERKQAELEARWLAAQTRKAEEDRARQRKMRKVGSIAASVILALLAALAWYFMQPAGGIGA